MKLPLYKQYASAEPVGLYPTCNFGGLAIYDIQEDYYGDECAVAAWDFGTGPQNIRRHKIHYTYTGRAYIRKAGQRYYFDQIMRCSI